MSKKEGKAELDESVEQPVDSELQNIIEAALYASSSPLGVRKIMALFPDDAQPSKVDIQNVIMSLEALCEHRGVELRRIGNGWRFQSKEKYSPWLRKLTGNKSPRYSRALLETLSIIAYRQPVTRGDIEEIRGVGVSSETIKTLEERDWVAQIGHRDVPGRPALFGTTQEFLEYFNMASLRELPELLDKRDLGEIAKDMNLTLPMDGVQGEQEAAKHREAQTEKNESEKAEADRLASAEVIELHPAEASEGPLEQTISEPEDRQQGSEQAFTAPEDSEPANNENEDPVAEVSGDTELEQADDDSESTAESKLDDDSVGDER